MPGQQPSSSASGQLRCIGVKKSYPHSQGQPCDLPISGGNEKGVSLMALDLPAPKVPGLQQPGNYLDLDQLGSVDLTTWIDYPGIKNGDRFMPNWR
ncbi:hypothetical protein ALO75_05050, partial [Pseudomonas syringae pv. coryli]